MVELTIRLRRAAWCPLMSASSVATLCEAELRRFVLPAFVECFFATMNKQALGGCARTDLASTRRPRHRHRRSYHPGRLTSHGFRGFDNYRLPSQAALRNTWQHHTRHHDEADYRSASKSSARCGWNGVRACWMAARAPPVWRIEKLAMARPTEAVWVLAHTIRTGVSRRRYAR
jgi:hypothetical protein